MSELEFALWPEQPGLGNWIPTELLADVITQLPGLADAGGWLRAVPNPQEPFPAVHLQVVWLADGYVYFATVSGFTVATMSPGHAAPRLADYRSISLDQLVSGAGDWSSQVLPTERAP